MSERTALTKDAFGREVERFWDTENNFSAGLLRVYDHWCLEVSYMQHTLGSFIVLCREPVERLSQLAPHQLSELGSVNREIEAALSNNPVFRPERFNYLQLGNALHHLHIHGIPRYPTQRQFAGRCWTDASYGSPPTWNSTNYDSEIIAVVRDELVTSLKAVVKFN